MVATEVENYLAGFTADLECDPFEAMIDTAGAGSSALPRLGLWAFKVFEGDDLDEALRRE